MDLCGSCRGTSSIHTSTRTWQALSEQQSAGEKHANRETRTEEGRKEGFKTFCPRTKSTYLKHFINTYTNCLKKKISKTATV